VNVRVAVTGRIVIVTVIVSPPTATTPAGGASWTLTTSSPETPFIEIGDVSRRFSWARVSASPATSTTAGWRLTEAISKPAAGTPVMTGFTSKVRLCRSE